MRRQTGMLKLLNPTLVKTFDFNKLGLTIVDDFVPSTI